MVLMLEYFVRMVGSLCLMSKMRALGKQRVLEGPDEGWRRISRTMELPMTRVEVVESTGEGRGAGEAGGPEGPEGLGEEG